MLEAQQAQLVSGLQELYKRAQNGQGWVGSPLKESTSGVPLTHDILERLGALKQEGVNGNDEFEEDLGALQARLIASGATMMQREPSHDDSSDSAPSPGYDSVPTRPKFANPFAMGQFPPTPPNRSPYPQNVRAVPQVKSQTYPQMNMQSNLQQWSTPMSEFEDGMDFINQYDSPVMDGSMDAITFPPHMFQDHMASAAINPYLTMKDWSHQEETFQYVNPAMI
jgi:hypothetical protein